MPQPLRPITQILQGRLLLDCTDAAVNPHGVPIPAMVRVRRLDGQEVGLWIEFDQPFCVHWRTARGDHVVPPSLAALLTHCRS